MSNNFDKYGFIETDKSENEMDHNEYYFEIEDDTKLQQFMNDYHVSLDQFNTSDAEDTDEFSGLDFQLSVSENGNISLEYGPVFYNSDEDAYNTVDVISCNIEGLDEYLYSLI